jgi:hypothetical protein
MSKAAAVLLLRQTNISQHDALSLLQVLPECFSIWSQNALNCAGLQRGQGAWLASGQGAWLASCSNIDPTVT